MYTAVVTIHIIVCIILVLTVLLQQGKGAEVGAVFGSSETMFGSTGPASALNKLTTVVAIIFMLTSLGLTYLAAHRKGDSVMENVKIQAPAVPVPAEQAAPAMPAESPSAASDTVTPSSSSADVKAQTSRAVAVPAETAAPAEAPPVQVKDVDEAADKDSGQPAANAGDK